MKSSVCARRITLGNCVVGRVPGMPPSGPVSLPSLSTSTTRRPLTRDIAVIETFTAAQSGVGPPGWTSSHSVRIRSSTLFVQSGLMLIRSPKFPTRALSSGSRRVNICTAALRNTLMLPDMLPLVSSIRMMLIG